MLYLKCPVHNAAANAWRDVGIASCLASSQGTSCELLHQRFPECEGVLSIAPPMPCRQLGIGNFEPLKPFFLEVYSGALAVVPTLPGTPIVPVPLEHAGSADERKSASSPALVRIPCS